MIWILEFLLIVLGCFIILAMIIAVIRVIYKIGGWE